MIKRDEDVVFRIQTKSAPRWQGLMTKVVGVIGGDGRKRETRGQSICLRAAAATLEE